MNNKYAEQKYVELWNQQYPVGTIVILIKDAGETILTKTRSKAHFNGANDAVIMLDHVSGYYLLERVIPVSMKGSK
jgi:hypothetical protein